MSHEAVYTRVLYPLPASRIWPVTGVMLVFEAHQTQAASTWWVLRTHPVRGDGQHWLTAPRMWMIVGSQGTGRVT